MEGIRITGQNLFSQESIDSAKNKVHSLIASKGMDIEPGPQDYQTQTPPRPRSQNFIQASSTLNSIEVRFQPYQGGTKIEVDHGITTIGLILGVLGLIFFALGLIAFLLWFLKYNETKDDLQRTFPGYLPPTQQQQYGGQQSVPSQGQRNMDSPPPADETSVQINSPEKNTEESHGRAPEPEEDKNDQLTPDD